jgi:serine/threonine-protein kinase RsbW
MVRTYSEQVFSVEKRERNSHNRGTAVFIVASDREFLNRVLVDCAEVPPDYRVFATIPDLAKELSSVEKLNVAVVLIVEKNGDDVDAPELRLFKLNYPQIFFIVLLGACEQRNILRLQSLGVQNILLPPFSEVSISREISTALPNVPHFKKHPDLAKRGQMRVNFLLPSDLSYVLGLNHFISLILKEFGFPVSESRINIPLACDEALTNAVLHGNGRDPDKKVNVQIYVSHSRFKIRIADQGDGFELNNVENPLKGDNLLRSSGRGIYMMRNIMDSVEFKDGGSVVEMEKVNPDASRLKNGNNS